jgi:hypothetical protein
MLDKKQPTVPQGDFIAWERIRVGRRWSPWTVRCRGPDLWETWAALLRLPSAGASCERVVKREGEKP